MKTKNLTMSAILLSLGAVMHLVIPGIFGGMKPDFLLVMMFMAILITGNLKETVVISVVAGIIAAMTTNFPMGQIPSIIDKIVSGITFYLMMSLFENKGNEKCRNIVLIVLNTIISGVVFLFAVVYITGFEIPVGMEALIYSVVLPTAVFNGVFGIIVTKVIRINKVRV